MCSQDHHFPHSRSQHLCALKHMFHTITSVIEGIFNKIIQKCIVLNYDIIYVFTEIYFTLFFNINDSIIGFANIEMWLSDVMSSYFILLKVESQTL